MRAAGPPGISQRVIGVAESATVAITTKAKAMRAAGTPVIGFGAGEPDFATPDHIVAAAIEAARDPKNHKYTPAVGLPEMRQAVADVTRANTGLDSTAQQVVVTNGGKQAVYLTCQALIDPGDEVLLPAPYWVTYPEAIKLADGVVVPILTDESTGYRVTVDQLEAARNDKTKMLIFVSPSNPSGAVYTRDEVRAIGEWAAANEIWVMTDEIYEHLVYGDAEFASMPVEAPAVAQRCVVVNGVAKTFAMTGWRVGWMVVPDALVEPIDRLAQNLFLAAPTPSQYAALAAFSRENLEELERRRGVFLSRRDFLCGALVELGFNLGSPPAGAFYIYADAGYFTQDSQAFCQRLLDEESVALTPGIDFGVFRAGKQIRFAYTTSLPQMELGIERLRRFLRVGS